MATAVANITSGIDFPNDASITRQDLSDGIENAIIGDFTRSHVASTSTLPSIGTTAPTSPPTLQTGELWVDTADPVDGSGTTFKVHTVKSFNGTVFRPANAWLVSATAPTYTAGTGMGWRDTTLNLYRMHGTVNGVIGWHPVDSGAYRLMNNRSGGTVAANRIVIFESTDTHSFTTTSIIKHGSVMGVTLESTDNGNAGVVALVAGGGIAGIHCNVTSGAVAIGDGICQSGTAGEGRTSGLLNTNANLTAGKPRWGTPLGVFAQALTTTAVAGVVTCRLLGHVGSGADLFFDEDEIADGGASNGWEDGEWDDTWRQINLEAVPFDGSDVILDNGDTKHKPILGVHISVDLSLTINATQGQGKVRFGPNQSAVTGGCRSGAGVTGVSTALGGVGPIYVPTTAGTPFNLMGQMLQWRGLRVNANNDTTNHSLRIVGYRY